MKKTNCVFCEIPEFIMENELAFAIYDKYPVSKGHMLIIPKRHISNFFDSTKEEKEALLSLIEEGKKILDEKYNPDGYNIGINVNEAAGQTIFHLHIHLIPRYSGDMSDPRGGVRGVIPNKMNYTLD